jgi:hypothetical protein
MSFAQFKEASEKLSPVFLSKYPKQNDLVNLLSQPPFGPLTGSANAGIQISGWGDDFLVSLPFKAYGSEIRASALSAAIEKGHIDAVSCLILTDLNQRGYPSSSESSSPLDEVSSSGKTPLHYLSDVGLTESNLYSLGYLCPQGNVKDQSGETFEDIVKKVKPELWKSFERGRVFGLGIKPENIINGF